MWRDEVADAGSAPGRSYKCVEKSDLKYPLIHGQGRQVSEWPPPRIPLKLPPAELGTLLSLAGGCGWGHRVCSKALGYFFLSPGYPRGHGPPVCLPVHLLSPHTSFSPGSITGNTGCLQGPGRPSAQSPGHKHSAQALLALCPTGEGARAHRSFHLPRKADGEAGGGQGALRDPGLTCR